MSPEQFRGGPIDARADVYGLGVLLFFTFTGSFPFDARTRAALSEQHRQAPAPRPSERAPLAPALDAIVLRCLEKQPEHRYGSAQALFHALRQAVTGAHRRAWPEAYMTAVGVAVYVEIRMRPEGAEVDESMTDDVFVIFDVTEETLR